MAKTRMALVATLLFTGSAYGAFLEGENQSSGDSSTPTSVSSNPNDVFPGVPQAPSNSDGQAAQFPGSVAMPGMQGDGEDTENDGDSDDGSSSPSFPGVPSINTMPPMDNNQGPSMPNNGDYQAPGGMIDIIISDMPMGATDPNDEGPDEEPDMPMFLSGPQAGNYPAGAPSNLDDMFQIINEAVNSMLGSGANSNGPDGKWPSIVKGGNSNPYKYPGLGGYLKGESRELAKNCTRAMDAACNCTSTGGMRCAKECWFDEAKIDNAVAEGCPVLSCHRATLKHCDTCFNASTFRINATCIAECDLTKTKELIDGGCTKLQCRMATNQTCTPICNDECADLCSDSATTTASAPTPTPETIPAGSTEPATRHWGHNGPADMIIGWGDMGPASDEQAALVKAYKCAVCTDRCFRNCRRDNAEALNKQGCQLKVHARPSTTADRPLKPTATVVESVTITESIVQTAAAAASPSSAAPAFPTAIETPTA